MKHLTLQHLAAVCRGRLIGQAYDDGRCITAITTDSRKVTEGCLFVPIRGARVDAHTFIDQVMKAGAYATLSERDLGETEFPYILVEHTPEAIRDIAEDYLMQLGIPVIGVAGSVGKTSTKEMIAAVLKQKYRVLKTEGNFNNDLGVPLTIFRLREEDEIAVLEMGISDFGEMHVLSKIVHPETCVLTNIGWCHLENLKTRDGILKAKSEIFDFMREQGHVILNGDDDKLSTIREVRGSQPLRYGLDPSNEIWADEIEVQGFRGTVCRIHTPQGSFRAEIPKPGKHMVLNALAACAVGLTYGLSLPEICRGLAESEQVSGRFRIVETEHCTVIDDCYNANPASMRASLEALQEAEGRKVAVLGDMGELGTEERSFHAQVGSFAAGLRLDAVYCAGPLSEALSDASKAGNPSLEVRHFPDRETLEQALPALIRPGDTVLVKASHYMEFEKIVRLLTEKRAEEKEQG